MVGGGARAKSGVEVAKRRGDGTGILRTPRVSRQQSTARDSGTRTKQSRGEQIGTRDCESRVENIVNLVLSYRLNLAIHFHREYRSYQYANIKPSFYPLFV